MKTGLFIRSFFTILTAVLTIGLQAQGNIARVGVVRNNQGIVTDVNEATRVLKGGLSATAVVSQITIDYSPNEGKYYLIGKISNDPVSGKAVQLNPTPDGGGLFAAIGPGVVITCTGTLCSSCLPDVKKWKPRCICHDSSPPAGMSCNMTSTVTISF